MPALRVRGRVDALPQSPLAIGVGALVLMAGLLGGLTYYSAGEFNKRAADTRASNEASSFAQHSSTLATGDAFSGYIQLLRDAEDPVFRLKVAAQDERVSALQQLLYLNVNRFASLTIADRSGLVLATTDRTIVSVHDSATFTRTRANLSPANSDVILPTAGGRGYVEYTTSLQEANGTNWGFLIARADPAQLWKATLLATVDGSRNVIINSAGQFAAGVPDALLGRPWKGSVVGTKGVRASIDGVESICGLAPIGKDTQIDRGLEVASCLPVSVIQAEHGQAMGEQGLVTTAGAVLAVMLAAVLLKLGLKGTAASAEAWPTQPQREDNDTEGQTLAALGASAAPTTADMTIDGQPPEPLQPLDIDAVALIDAYEQRNARLAERLRESVQTKLMVAATKADEAYKLAGSNEELSTSLHGHAMEELERLRERELRAIGQELYPALTRLGLPSALRGLAKDLADTIEVTLDVDASVDALSAGAGRAPIARPLRLMLYRAAQDGARAFALAGANACTVSLRREGADLALQIDAVAPAGLDRTLLAASIVSVEARAGSTDIVDEAAKTTISVLVPAGSVQQETYAPMDDVEPLPEDPADFADAPPLAPAAARTNLVEEIGRLEREYAGRLELEVDAPVDAPGLPAPLHKTFLGLMEASFKSMATAGASRCAVTLGVSDSVWKLALASDGDGAAFDAPSLGEYEFGLEAFGGGCSVDRRAAHIHVTAEARVPDSGTDLADTATDAIAPTEPDPIEFVAAVRAPPADPATPSAPSASGLVADIQRLEREYAGRVELETYVRDDGPELPAPLHKTFLGLMETSLVSMAAAGASRCEVTLGVTDGVWKLVLISDGDGSAFDAPALGEYEFGLEAFEGGSSVDCRPGHVRVAAEARIADAGVGAAKTNAA